MAKKSNNNKISVNEIIEDEEEMDDILETKDSLIYLNNKKFTAILDSGAKSNFISRLIFKKLGLETHKNTKAVKCDIPHHISLYYLVSSLRIFDLRHSDEETVLTVLNP